MLGNAPVDLKQRQEIETSLYIQFKVKYLGVRSIQ